jgi:hypothetical protein
MVSSPTGTTRWTPTLRTRVLERQSDACLGCCPVLNFFASTENASSRLASHADVRGAVISMDDASAAGARAVFGDVLKEV